MSQLVPKNKGSLVAGATIAGKPGFKDVPAGPDGYILVCDSSEESGLAFKLHQDIFASTRVVSLIPGEGTDLTIDAAILALGAAGGTIYVKDGTFPTALAYALTPGKPIVIRGSGDATIIDLGANAIPAFTIATGYTGKRQIVFENFKVIGTEVAGQTVLLYGDNDGLAEVYMRNITTEGVELTIDSNSTASASSTPGQDDPRFHLFRCRIRPCSTNNSVILHNSSFGLPRAWLKEVEFIGDSLFAIPALRVDPLFGRLADDTWFGDCYLDNCELSLGTGENDFATFESFSSTLWKNDSTLAAVVFGLNGSFEGLNPGVVRDSACRGINFQAFEGGSNFFSNWLQNCPLDLFGAGIVVGDNEIIQSGAWPAGFAFMIRVQNENTQIRNNRVRASTPPTAVVDIEAPCRVHANDFSEVHPPTDGTLFIDNGDCVITDNEFTFAPTTGPNVKEINGPNMYDNNVRLFTNKTGGGPIIDPIIPRGNGSTVQGTVDFNAAGSVGGVATNSIVVWYRNPFGLAKVQGYIENTGLVNNITVRESYLTQNEGTATRSTVLVPGAKLVIDPYNIGGLGIDNQVVDYRVDVSGTTISWHTYFPGVNCVVAT